MSLEYLQYIVSTLLMEKTTQNPITNLRTTTTIESIVPVPRRSWWKSVHSFWEILLKVREKDWQTPSILYGVLPGKSSQGADDLTSTTVSNSNNYKKSRRCLYTVCQQSTSRHNCVTDGNIEFILVAEMYRLVVTWLSLVNCRCCDVQLSSSLSLVRRDADRQRLVRTEQWRSFRRRRLCRRRQQGRSLSHRTQRHEGPVDGVAVQRVPRRRPITAAAGRQRQRRGSQVAQRRRRGSGSRLERRDERDRRRVGTGRGRRVWRHEARVSVQQRRYSAWLHHVRIETRLVSSSSRSRRRSSCRHVIRPDNWL